MTLGAALAEFVRVERVREPRADGRRFAAVKTHHSRSGARHREELMLWLGPLRITVPRQLRWREGYAFTGTQKRTWLGQ